MLDAERAGAFDEPVHRRAVERSGPAAAIRASKSRQQLQVHLLGETTKGAVTDVLCLVKHAWLQMLSDEAEDLTTHVEAVDGVHVQPIEQRFGGFDAGLLVIERTDAAIDEGRGQRLAEVMT